MSLPLLWKIGATLGVGGFVYWAVSRWHASAANAAGRMPTTTQDGVPGAMPNAYPDTKPKYSPPAPAKPSSGKDYSGISGTTHGADGAGGTILSAKGIEDNILDDDRKTVRPGYHVSPTETWRDPGDRSLYAIWFRNSDGARGVFYEGLFRRME